MSNEIDDLIANIEQKFDDEFKDSNSNKLESPNKEKQAGNSNELNHNPESDRKNSDQNNKYETAKKKDVTVIE